MTPAVLTEFVLNGLVLGALYVLMALGLSIIFGLTMVLEQGIRMVWGLSPKQFDVPPAFGGALRLGALTYSKYRSFILLAVVVLIVALTLFLQKTPVGTIVRAGSRDPMMVRLLGVSLRPVLTFRFRPRTGFAAKDRPPSPPPPRHPPSHPVPRPNNDAST